MTYFGKVSKGAVIFPPEVKLPDGIEVRVEPMESAIKPQPIGKRLLALAGVVKNLPGDFARNHNHYLHGIPKLPPA
jgi:hypothetical protein